MNEPLFRACCVATAAALAAAPYWPEIRSAAERAAQAFRANGGSLMRWGAALLLLAAATGVQLPHLPSALPAAAITVEAPSVELQAKVAGVAAALKSANAADRALWASVWDKAATVVAGDAVATDVAFTDTRSLRTFTVLALDIAWRRLGGNQPGKYAGLREATEKALGDIVGLDVKPVTPELRARYAEACRAIAWAGIGRG